MSRIVQLHGNAAERHATANEIAEGMFLLGTIESTRFLTKEKWYPNRSESDVIMVFGKLWLVDELPESTRGTFVPGVHYASDYVVVLEKPDTILFNLSSDVPAYIAESGHAHGCLAVICSLFGFLMVMCISLLAGQGSWSTVWALMMGGTIAAVFKLERWMKAEWAALCGWWYIRSRIQTMLGTRHEYIYLVAHLSKCDDPVVADINTRILRWI